ncbi:MAG: phosphohydrolase, partial [Pleurocapsa sp. SU_196_0]|nr:phosphohydrolase [Pleurocapsa sp. SU_196_0]
IETVYDLCARVSFKGAGVADDMPTLEGRVVQDADRLDAIGAIGIARTFAFGGAKGRAMHDPQEASELHQDFEAYKSKNGSSLNHFFEKLLLLRDRLHTQSAQAIALKRHAYMEGFVQQFLAEWDAHD